MKTKAAFLVLSLIFISQVSHSQAKSSDPSFKRNVIGISYNPHRGWNEKFIDNVYTIRYGYKIAQPFTIGTEISASFPNGNYPEITTWDPDFSIKDRYGLSAGLFLRYSLRSDKQLQFFLEVSPYTSLYLEKPVHYKGSDLFVYAAPGMSLYSKNRKFSMDLYYRLSTAYSYRGNHGTLAYKLNFHF